MYKEWLVTQLTREECIKDLIDDIGDPSFEESPFFDQFLAFLNTVGDDELWKFSNGESAFRSLAGRRGYCIVRDGKIISHCTTFVS